MEYRSKHQPRTNEREKKNTCIAWNSNREMIFHELNIAQTTRKTLYQQSIQEWWCWVGPGVAQCCDIFFIFPPLRDHQAKTRLKAVFWERYTGHDALEIATALPASGFFSLYISIIIRSRLYGIKNATSSSWTKTTNQRIMKNEK